MCKWGNQSIIFFVCTNFRYFERLKKFPHLEFSTNHSSLSFNIFAGFKVCENWKRMKQKKKWRESSRADDDEIFNIGSDDNIPDSSSETR